MAELDGWQHPDGFPKSAYFTAVAEALAAAGVELEIWHNDEAWNAAFVVDRNQVDPDGGNGEMPQRGMFAAWKCDEDDQPKHADDFTGEGWYWCPCTDADKHGDYVVSLNLPWLAEPADVAAAVVAVLRDEYGVTVTTAP